MWISIVSSCTPLSNPQGAGGDVICELDLRTARPAMARWPFDGRACVDNLARVSNDPVRALAAMRDALEACSYAIPHPANGHVAANGRTTTLEEFAATFQQLSDEAVRLHGQLGEHDPLHGIVRRTLIEAQQAWTAMLLEGSVTALAGGGPATDGESARGAGARVPSSALVPLARPGSLVRRPLGRNLPDESTIGRALRLRRERGGRRLPDEATIARFVRLRREAGPRFPTRRRSRASSAATARVSSVAG